MTRQLKGYVVQCGIGLMGTDPQGRLWHTRRSTLFESRADAKRAIRYSKKDGHSAEFWEKNDAYIIALYSA